MHIFTVAQCSTSVDANLDSVDELWRDLTELLLTELIPTIYQAMCSAKAHCRQTLRRQQGQGVVHHIHCMVHYARQHSR